MLGLVLGLALASFAAARDTASAYGRVLDAADAETAVVAHNSPDEAAAILDTQPAIARHRYQGGFLAFIEEVDPALTGGVLAPAGDEFPLELPTLEAGRLPDPDRADEVFINSVLADATGFEVGAGPHRARVLSPTPRNRPSGPSPSRGSGFSRERRWPTRPPRLASWSRPERSTRRTRSYRLYSNSRVWLDDPRDFPALARALSAEGMFVSETRAQERHGVEEALGPTVTVLVALGLLASLATVVLAVQVVQRRQDRWRADDAVLTALGGTRGARAVIHLASVAAEVALASVIAVGVMLGASPVAPIGPLHDLDPAQGVHLDLTVAVSAP